MTPEQRFLVLAVCIYLPLVPGYLSRELGLLDPAASKRIQATNLLTLESLVVLIGAWNLDISEPGRALLVPVIGALVSLGLLGVGFAGARLLGEQGRRRGAYLACSMMSNIGLSLGGFLCYMFLGMTGQSLAVAYMFHFLPVCFVTGMFIASYYAGGRSGSVRRTVSNAVRNPLLFVPMGALLTGIAINASGVPMPGWVAPANGVALMVMVAAHSFAIGLTLRLGRLGDYWREIGALAVTKFALGPVIGAAVVVLLGQWSAFEGVLWRVVVIEGAMPVAIFATILANLFDLDRDLANSAWVATTLASAAVIPILYLVTAG